MCVDIFNTLDISIHALHEESDRVGLLGHFVNDRFQSTLSMRRATTDTAWHTGDWASFQSTLSMRRATIVNTSLEDVLQFQSTLSMRRATCANSNISVCMSFQSTLSMRRATGCHSHFLSKDVISIHALHEESD